MVDQIDQFLVFFEVSSHMVAYNYKASRHCLLQTSKKKPVRKENTSEPESSNEWSPSGESSEIDSDSDIILTTTDKNPEIGTEGPALKEGDLALISFPGQKNNKYKFVCIVQRISVEEDIEVMSLKHTF